MHYKALCNVLNNPKTWSPPDHVSLCPKCGSTLYCVCVGSHTCYMWAVPSHTPLDVLQLTAPSLGSCQARPSLPSDTSGMSVTLSCQHSFSMLNCCCHFSEHVGAASNVSLTIEVHCCIWYTSCIAGYWHAVKI